MSKRVCNIYYIKKGNILARDRAFPETYWFYHELRALSALQDLELSYGGIQLLLEILLMSLFFPSSSHQIKL